MDFNEDWLDDLLVFERLAREFEVRATMTANGTSERAVLENLSRNYLKKAVNQREVVIGGINAIIEDQK